MYRVGEGGKGESVWLGWLLYATLNGFAPTRGETRRCLASPCGQAAGIT